MIEAHRLTRRFQETTAVDRVDFTVHAGRVTGFVGPNGSGKSTVLRMICGLLPPTAGEVLVEGLDPIARPREVRGLLSYLPGETSLYIHMRGNEYLRFINHFRPRPDRELEAELLRLFALPMERKIRTYSAGMKQKLALCAVLTAGVPLYLLDEPTRALDANMREQLVRALELMRERGRTIFLSSHHLSDIERICDDMIFLMSGRVVPADRVRKLQESLSAQVRVALAPGGSRADLDLPEGCPVEERAGLLCIDPDGDPRNLVGRLARGPVKAIYWGRAELAEIYSRLYLEGDGKP